MSGFFLIADYTHIKQHGSIAGCAVAKSIVDVSGGVVLEDQHTFQTKPC